MRPPVPDSSLGTASRGSCQGPDAHRRRHAHVVPTRGTHLSTTTMSTLIVTLGLLLGTRPVVLSSLEIGQVAELAAQLGQHGVRVVRADRGDTALCVRVTAAPGGGLSVLLDDGGFRQDGVERALARLPEIQREAFVLCDVLGLSTKEAAQIAETPPGTLGRRLYDARRALRDLLYPEAER